MTFPILGTAKSRNLPRGRSRTRRKETPWRRVRDHTGPLSCFPLCEANIEEQIGRRSIHLERLNARIYRIFN